MYVYACVVVVVVVVVGCLKNGMSSDTTAMGTHDRTPASDVPANSYRTYRTRSTQVQA